MPLTAEPIFLCLSQWIEGYVRTYFHLAVGDGQRIVKHAGVGEVAHGKTIQPLQRTGRALAVVVISDANLPGKHYQSRSDALPPRLSGPSLLSYISDSY